MSKKYLSVQKLNEEIEKIIDAGFTPPTRLFRFQEGRTVIVIGRELLGEGFIRTYEESSKFLRRKGLKPLTKADYRKALKSLQDDLGALRTERGVRSFERKRLLALVRDMDEYLGTKTNAKKMNTEKLYKAVKQASMQKTEGSGNSPKFYENLHEILDSI